MNPTEAATQHEDLNAPAPAKQRAADRYGCAYCATLASFKGDCTRMPKTCPTRTLPALTKDTSGYVGADRQALMQAADQTPFTADRQLRNRAEEVIDYAQRRGYRKLGVAFCVSLIKEAQVFAWQLDAAGLASEIVCCRVGAVDYNEIGLSKRDPSKFAAICNPVAQGKLLNQAGVDLVVQVGLCVGHDIVLQEECDAPVTTLVVKDRALDHHPVRALRPALPDPSKGTHE